MHHAPELLRLLHDPVGYYRPWRQACATLQPAQRSALNAWLVQQHALPAYSAPPAGQDALTRRLVQGWARLPQVAYLLACAKHRERLLGDRRFLQLPAAVHALLRLPFASAGDTGVDVQDPGSLQAWGAAYLLQGLQGQLPPWLQARLRLCFHGLALPPLSPRCHRDPFDMSCFWSAWNHAEDLP